MEEENSKEEPMDDIVWAKLEKEFVATLEELKGDRNLEKYRHEYEQIFRVLKKTRDNENRLKQKSRELKAEIVANSAKVSSCLKLTQDSEVTAANLKKELEKTWELLEKATAKELAEKQRADGYQREIANLTKMLEKGAEGRSSGQEQSLNELLRVKEELTQERDERLKEITELREKIAESQSEDQKMEAQQAELNEKIQELQQDIQVRNNEAQREARKKDKLERELRQLKTDLDSKMTEIKTLQQQNERYMQDQAKLEKEIKDNKIAFERQQKDNELIQARHQKMQIDLETQIGTCNELNTENQTKALELKQKEEEINQLKQETQRLNKLRETAQRKLRTVEEQKTEIEQQREIHKNQIAAMEKELEMSKKQAETDRKTIEELQRERDILSKNMVKSTADTQKQVNLVKLHEQTRINLLQEIKNYQIEANKQRQLIHKLEIERDRYITEASDLTQKVLANMDDVKSREMQIFDYKKKIAEAETKLKQQQNLYEAVRSDRNLYSKNLIETQDEIADMKRKLKIMNHQIDQLKEEVSSKEAALVKEHLEHQRVEKEKDALKEELQKMKAQAADTKAHIEAQEMEERKLVKIIAEADAERLRQKKELDAVISERDILGTQLVRRNDELALLYEKIKIQKSTLNKGEVQYNQRLDDVRVLKLEIRKMRREKKLMDKSVRNLDDLRREVYHLQRELLRERTRCKALEEELENPMNIHRWRKLEGSDPSMYEMIQKMQTLQKRLIAKTEEVVEKELMINEKDKLYIELKHILSRHPGPEVAEQIQIYQSSLKEKNKQLQAMQSEINMHQSQVKEFKYEMELLSRELQEVRKKYFMQKKKEQQQRDQDRALAQAGMSPIQPQLRPDQPRFIGGGFNLKQITAKTAA